MVDTTSTLDDDLHTTVTRTTRMVQQADTDPAQVHHRITRREIRRRSPISVADCLCCGFWCVVSLAVSINIILMFAVYFHDDEISIPNNGRLPQLQGRHEPPDRLSIGRQPTGSSSSSRVALIIAWTSATSDPPTTNPNTLESNVTTLSASKNHHGPLSQSVLQMFNSIDLWIDRWTSKSNTKTSDLTSTQEFPMNHESITKHRVPNDKLSTDKENNFSKKLQRIQHAIALLSTNCVPSCSMSVKVPREILLDGLLRPASLRLFADSEDLFISRVNWPDRKSLGRSAIEIVSGKSILNPLITRVLLSTLSHYENHIRSEQRRSLTPSVTQTTTSPPNDAKILPRLFGAVFNRIRNWSKLVRTPVGTLVYPEPSSTNSPEFTSFGTEPQTCNRTHEQDAESIFKRSSSGLPGDDVQRSLHSKVELRQPNGLTEHIDMKVESKTKPPIDSSSPYWRLAASEDVFGSDWILGHAGSTTGEIAIAYRWQFEEDEEWRIKLLMRSDRCIDSFQSSGEFLSLQFRIPGNARVSELAIADHGLIYSRYRNWDSIEVGTVWKLGRVEVGTVWKLE